MADVRIPSRLPTVATPAPARSADAVRAAQRAFFNTALADTGGAAAVRAAAPATAQAAPAAAPLRPQIVPGADAQERPARALRPGSLLDIRV